MSVTNWSNKSVEFSEKSPEFQEMSCDAHDGNAKAQFGLGKWYDVRGRDEEAIRWYKTAADQGHEGAAEALAEIIERRIDIS